MKDREQRREEASEDTAGRIPRPRALVGPRTRSGAPHGARRENKRKSSGNFPVSNESFPVIASGLVTALSLPLGALFILAIAGVRHRLAVCGTQGL